MATATAPATFAPPARVGRQRISAIPPQVLADLNAGHIATVGIGPASFWLIDLEVLARDVACHGPRSPRPSA